MPFPTYSGSVTDSSDIINEASPPDDPELMLQSLHRLEGPEEFWNTVRQWASPDHIHRRRAYYDARFAREKIGRESQLFWLAAEFYSDVALQDDAFRRDLGLRPLAECPFPSRVALDEFLATITALDAWPSERLGAFMKDGADDLTELAALGVLPARLALERLKVYARTAFNATWHPPVLLLS